MALRRRWLSALGLVPILLAALSGCSAVTVGSVPTTGPLYLPGATAHSCTASVIASPTRDLVITAAHCIFGTGAGFTFVPGSVNGSAPYGRWSVTAAYVDPDWKADQNPLKDVAILRVAPQSIGGATRLIQDLTGSNNLVITPSTIGQVVVPAYDFGVGGSPITCLASAYRVGAYSAFDCGGYEAGTSGAPWIQGFTVIGVIGGLHQGGCTPSTSYSAPFDTSTLQTWSRAVHRTAADLIPVAGSDGC